MADVGDMRLLLVQLLISREEQSLKLRVKKGFGPDRTCADVGGLARREKVTLGGIHSSAGGGTAGGGELGRR
jgi:hypothetical protein